MNDELVDTSDLEELCREREVLVDYLDLMRTRKDWHGVRDAAADLEKIEAVIAFVTREYPCG